MRENRTHGSEGGESDISSRPLSGHRKPIGRLIGAYKTVSTKRINELGRTPGARLWQRNYYEHIIHDEDEFNLIRQYILDNPARWETDRENPNVGNATATIRDRPYGTGRDDQAELRGAGDMRYCPDKHHRSKVEL